MSLGLTKIVLITPLPQILRPSTGSTVITSIQYLTETPQVKQQPWIGFLHLCTDTQKLIPILHFNK